MCRNTCNIILIALDGVVRLGRDHFIPNLDNYNGHWIDRQHLIYLNPTILDNAKRGMATRNSIND